MKEHITIDGYTVTIEQDECPMNPFEEWDCEPPLLTYYGGRHGYFKSYNGPESLGEIIDLIPWSFAEHEQAYPYWKLWKTPGGLARGKTADYHPGGHIGKIATKYYSRP